MPVLTFVIIAVGLAWVYDFFNGANDRANSIATVTATKALTPMQALVLAGIFNFAGALVSTKVAETIGKGIVPPEHMTQLILIAGLVGAIIWVASCTRLGIPVSVTHALIGGLMGSGIAGGGLAILQWTILTNKIFLAIVLGPLLGLIAGGFLLWLISWISYVFFKKTPSNTIERFYRRGQIFSASFMSFTHGMNDTQNAMGVITVALLLGGFITVFEVPLWVKLSSGLIMGIGTFTMGWRVMKTLGWRVAKLEPKHGFAAETGAGLVIGIKSLIGMPVSTTHVIGSAVIGGTALQRTGGVRWMVARDMVLAWVITIPAAGVVAALSYFILAVLI